jgi:LysM repeat protein
VLDDPGPGRPPTPSDPHEGDPPIDRGVLDADQPWLDDEVAQPEDDDGLDARGAEVEPAPVVPDRETWLPLIEDRSPNEWVCPFLRSAGADGALGPPIEVPDAANRCAALREAAPQSLRQQELVCLTNGHVNCPRYLRGALVITEIAKPSVRARSGVTPAILAAVAILAFAFAVSAAFVVERGGLTLSAAVNPPSPDVAVVAPTPTAPPTAEAQASPATTSAPSAAVATPTATTPPSAPPPTTEPTPVPSQTPEPTPRSSSDRYALLEPCPDEPDCWVYTIRSGDNLFSIANYFGVRLSRVYKLNPWARTQGIRAGQELILPSPTR